MFRLLARIFIREAGGERKARESYTLLAGIVGIFCNALMFVSKLVIGILTQSIAIIGDAINNFSDVSSSLVAVLSAKVSSKEADENHPFGHGRFEYIASLIIAFIIVLVGFEVLKRSVGKIIAPANPEFSVWGLAIMIGALLLKLWMFQFNRYVGKRFDSPVNFAVAADSMNDVLGTAAIVLSIALGPFTLLPLDGIAGVIVSLYIMYSGYRMGREMIDHLMGTAPSPETVAQMIGILRSDSRILDVHHCKMHDYGVGQIVCSVHVDMDETQSFVQAHDVIDRLEQRVQREMGIDLVIHIDPVRCTDAECENNPIHCNKPDCAARTIRPGKGENE